MVLALTDKEGQPERPVEGHRENFKTLIRAIAEGNVGLMEVQIKATGEKVAAICAFQRNGKEIEMVPFALFMNGNPYELLNPPDPEGGFFPTFSQPKPQQPIQPLTRF